SRPPAWRSPYLFLRGAHRVWTQVHIFQRNFSALRKIKRRGTLDARLFVRRRRYLSLNCLKVPPDSGVALGAIENRTRVTVERWVFKHGPTVIRKKRNRAHQGGYCHLYS